MLPTPEQLPTPSDYRRATIELDRLFASQGGPRKTIDRFSGNGLLRSRRGTDFLQRVDNLSGMMSMGHADLAWSHTEDAQATAKALKDGMLVGALLTDTIHRTSPNSTPEHMTRINRGIDVVLRAAEYRADEVGDRAVLFDQLHIAGRWGMGALSTSKEIIELWEEILLHTSNSAAEGMVQVGVGIIIDADFASRQGLFEAAQRRLRGDFNEIVDKNDLNNMTADTESDWDKHWREFQEGA